MGQCHGSPCSSRLELPPLAMPGDYVRVKRWVKVPHCGGWDGVKPGAVGVVKKVHGQVVKVHFKGYVGLWHGYQPELEVLDRMHRSIRRQHTGQWRHEKMKHACSTPATQEGAFCSHGDAQQRQCHWSCCGSTAYASWCTAPAWTPPPTPQTTPQDQLVCVGDEVRLKHWVSEPTFLWGDVTPWDVGVVKSVTEPLICTVQFARLDRPWKAYAPELEAVGKPTQHAGTWRQGRDDHHCSRPDAQDGPLCRHGGDDVLVDHWSCCGSTDLISACSQR